jgi:formylglycine-generating enzyme required for sulfatase activity/beta-lactamase regulating signal transducer with metallopeptidase domain
MNTLGLGLVWWCVQATLFLLAGLAVYVVSRRRGPAVGALTASATLLVLTGVSLLALSPWPVWWTPARLGRPPVLRDNVADAGKTVASARWRPTEQLTDADDPTPGPWAPNAEPFENSTAGAGVNDGTGPAWQTVLDQMQPEPARQADAQFVWRWSGFVGLVFFIGMSLALVRLLLGLWVVHRYRAGSLTITDPAPAEEIRQFAADMGFRRPIEVRQSHQLGAPATIGWRRPLVLLPPVWKGWSREERRVVLAHEVAHVARGDYPAWLLAQLSLALHFYHPIVHWLTRRLRLEQELAADVLGARLVGGRELYLVTLTRMVLDQTAVNVSFAARPFFSTRGTFLKRIEMLGAGKAMHHVPWTRRQTATLFAAMALFGLIVAGVRVQSGVSVPVQAGESQPAVDNKVNVGNNDPAAEAQNGSSKLLAETKPGTSEPPPPAIAPFDAERARKHQEAWAQYAGVPVECTNSLGMKFELIPPGKFMMGSTAEEIEEGLKLTQGMEAWFKSQAPRHSVILTQLVYVGVHEVTQAEYEKVMGNNPSSFAASGNRKDISAGTDTSRQPVEHVSWNAAAEFCNKLSEQEKLKPCYDLQGKVITPLAGTGYRLPTEAEWEHACRAGTTTKYWLGNDDRQLANVAWVANNSHYRGTTAIGSFKPNPFGLQDMHGNVSEWVQDWAEPTYYEQFMKNPAVDPLGPPQGTANRRPWYKVCRGGSWYNAASICRSADRCWFDPSDASEIVGFRVVLSPLALVPKATPAREPAKRIGDQQKVAEAKVAGKSVTLAELQSIVVDQIRSIRSLHISYTKTEPKSFGGKSQDHVWAEQGFKLLKRDVPGETVRGYAESFDGKRTYQLGYDGEQPAGTNVQDEFRESIYLSVSSSMIGWLHTSGHRESIINAIRSPTAKLVVPKEGAPASQPGPTIEVTEYRRSGADQHALHVTLVLDREHGYLPSSITYHAVSNPSWKFAHDVDEFMKVRDAATGTDRWFPARGRYKQQTPEQGEQVFTTVFNKVTINDALPDDLFVLYADSPPAAPGQEQQALADFEQAYQLEPGQLVKRIKRPYLPGRILNYQKWWAGAFAQSNYKTSGTFLPAVYPERDGKLGQPSFHFVGGIERNTVPASDLINSLGAVLDLRWREVEDPDKLLEQKVEGDYVIRADAPLDKVFAAFGQVLKTECGVPVSLEFREVERPVVVISGEIKPPFVLKPETILEFSATAPSGKEVTESGTFDKFMQAVGKSIQPNRRVLSEIKNYPYRNETISWRGTVPVASDDKTQEEKASRALLDRLEKQTGLTFTLSSHKFPIISAKRSQ